MVPHTPRRPGHVRDPVARAHARRHDRHADSRSASLEPTAQRERDRLHPRDGRPLPARSADARRRAERRSPASARWCKAGDSAHDGRAVARSHDPHRCVRAADDRRRANGRPTGTWPKTPSTRPSTSRVCRSGRASPGTCGSTGSSRRPRRQGPSSLVRGRRRIGFASSSAPTHRSACRSTRAALHGLSGRMGRTHGVCAHGRRCARPALPGAVPERRGGGPDGARGRGS